MKSPTDPLDEVYFPSAVVCNMNALRRSFLSELMKDPDLRHWDYPTLFRWGSKNIKCLDISKRKFAHF